MKLHQLKETQLLELVYRNKQHKGSNFWVNVHEFQICILLSKGLESLISGSALPQRPMSAIYAVVRRMYERQHTESGPWTPAEDTLLAK